MAIEKCESVLITPEMAQSLLDGYRENRPLSKLNVDKFVNHIISGTFAETHQGILLGKEGRLLDGQHRMHAIVRTNTPARLQVSTDPTLTHSHGPYDSGLSRRESWVLGIDHGLCSAAKAIGLFGMRRGGTKITVSRSNAVHGEKLRMICDAIAPTFYALARSQRVGFNVLGVSCPTIVASMMSKLPQEVINQHRMIVEDERAGMWPIVVALDRFIQGENTRRRGNYGSGLVIAPYSFRALSADHRQRQSTKIVASTLEDAADRLTDATRLALPQVNWEK